MKFEVNVEKKYAFLIVGILLVLGVLGYVYAYTAGLGVVPNPGHLLSEMQGYFQGDANLNVSLGKFCQSDGTNCVSSGVSGKIGLGVKMMNAGIWCDTNNGNDYGSQHIFESDTACVLSRLNWNMNPEDSVTTFLYNSTPIRRVILTSFSSEGSWPATGTNYTFDGGTDTGLACGSAATCYDNLPFNTRVPVYNYNGRTIAFTLNVINSSNPGTVHTFPASLRVELTGGDTAEFDVTYETFCLTYEGVCLDQ